mgnify:CR=1 FL=1
MAQDTNSITIVGRTTADIELKTTTSGKQVANFTLANSGMNDNTNFIDVVAWGKAAEILAQYSTKGKQLAITGRLTTRQYEDKDGKKRKQTEVVVNDFQLLGGKTDAPQRDVVPIEVPDEPIDLSELNIPF